MSNIQVWCLSPIDGDGFYKVETLEEVMEEIQSNIEYSNNASWTISLETMTREEFNSLPEFNGW